MSRKNKSDFVSASGVVFEIIKKIYDAIRTLGGNDEDLRCILTDSTLAQKMAEVIMASRSKVREIYNVVVYYGLSLSEMIKLGNYGQVNSEITDLHFPIQGSGNQEFTLELVHLNRYAKIEEVREQLASQGLEAAWIELLLAFGAEHPNVWQNFRVVALGSYFVAPSGDHAYPYLDNNDDGQGELDLIEDFEGVQWGGDWRFLAVRK
jgi:hypothetical protein